ncbi:hypothetical protein KKD72_03120 [Patescibacteria group bacterium]|nr:hypothetical protein [Patescibacteria group bacterium]
MADYTEQLNQARKENAENEEIGQESAGSISEITDAEWLLIGFVGVIADLLGPAGFIFSPIILLWYTIRFHRFPIKKLIGFGSVEIISLGFLPGWTGFVVITFLEQRGHLPQWMNKLIGAKK